MPQLKAKGFLVPLLIGAAVFLTACTTKTGGDGEDVNPVEIPAANMEYIVLAWNDLGMHCLNPTYDKEVILPPYNTLWAQVVKRGNPPQIVTSGIRLEYAIVNNTYSYGKRSYGQFWDNSFKLFGLTLDQNTGLNLVDPDIHNGLSGQMLLKGNHYQVNGIPVTPVDDAGAWSPYQVAEVVVKDETTGAELGRTRATVPVSDEINCAKCHGVGDVKAVLEQHDESEGTTLAADKPVLCASCHGSPALGQTGAGSSGLYLSKVIHGFHSTKNASCYDCHPGTNTKCNRSVAHTASDGHCTTCHGTLANVASSITGGRVPWEDEPKCASCHTFVAEVDTGTTLYRNASGHHGLSCPACHGSPHAQVPSEQTSDHYQSLQYQNKALPLGTCRACHNSSKGGGLSDFMEAHGPGQRPTACSVCHTAIPTNNPSDWPHKFQQRTRTAG